MKRICALALAGARHPAWLTAMRKTGGLGLAGAKHPAWLTAMRKTGGLALAGILLLAAGACDLAPPPTTQPGPPAEIRLSPIPLLTLVAPASAVPSPSAAPLANTTPAAPSAVPPANKTPAAPGPAATLAPGAYSQDLVARLIYVLPDQEARFLPQGFDWDRSAVGRVSDNHLDLGLKPSGLTSVYWQTVIGPNATTLYQMEYQAVFADSAGGVGAAIAALTAADSKLIDKVQPLTTGLAPGASGLSGTVTSNGGTSDIITLYAPVGNSNIFAYVIALGEEGTLKLSDVQPYAGSFSAYMVEPAPPTVTLPVDDPTLLLQPEQLPSGYDFGPSGPMRPAVYFGTAQDAARIAPGATGARVNTFSTTSAGATLGFVESAAIVFDSPAKAASAANAMVAEVQKGLPGAQLAPVSTVRPGLQIVYSDTGPTGQYAVYDFVVPTGNVVQEITFVWAPGTADAQTQSTELFKKVGIPK